LKAQWSGLFQSFLQNKRRLAEIEVLNEMSSVANTLKELVKFLTEERSNKDDAIKNILLSNHPAFRVFANLTEAKYRVYFTNQEELDAWLSARGWKFDPSIKPDPDSVSEWVAKDKQSYIKLTSKIFDDNGHLIPMTEGEWKEGWLKRQEINGPPPEDEIPF
jgi:hypothetical protein